MLGCGTLTPGEQLELFIRMGMPKYYKTRLFFVPVIICTVKEDRDLASGKRKALTYEPFRPFLGYHSILFQEGAKARKEREMLNKGFGQETYRSVHPIMIRATERFIERTMEETRDKGFFNTEQLLSRATLEVITEGAFSFKADKPENIVYLEALKRLMRIPGHPVCLLPYGTQLMQWWNRDALSKVHELLDKTIVHRITSTNQQSGSMESPKDLLDLVIASSRMGESEPNLVWIRDQVNLLLIGGSDTSSVTLWWSFILLAARPEIQQKIKEEIKEVFSRFSEPYERVANLNYTEGFIKEVLRLYPPFTASVGD